MSNMFKTDLQIHPSLPLLPTCIPPHTHTHTQVRFLVMSNMFKTDLQIHRKFDLKGSTHGRTVGEQNLS
jgi:hypothetical protein